MNELHLDLLFDEEAGKRIHDWAPWILEAVRDLPCECVYVMAEGSQSHLDFERSTGAVDYHRLDTELFHSGIVAYALPSCLDGPTPFQMRQAQDPDHGSIKVSRKAAAPTPEPAATTGAPALVPTPAANGAVSDHSYRPGRAAEGMRLLAAKYGHHYQHIEDVGEYVRNLRAD